MITLTLWARHRCRLFELSVDRARHNCGRRRMLNRTLRWPATEANWQSSTTTRRSNSLSSSPSSPDLENLSLPPPIPIRVRVNTSHHDLSLPRTPVMKSCTHSRRVYIAHEALPNLKQRLTRPQRLPLKVHLDSEAWPSERRIFHEPLIGEYLVSLLLLLLLLERW